MGFWDSIGTAAAAIGNGIKEKYENANQLSEEYENKSDEYLKQKLRSSNISEKAAAAKVLKSRGYGPGY